MDYRKLGWPIHDYHCKQWLKRFDYCGVNYSNEVDLKKGDSCTIAEGIKYPYTQAEISFVLKFKESNCPVVKCVLGNRGEIDMSKQQRVNYALSSLFSIEPR